MKIKYRGYDLCVKFPRRVIPFGVNTKTDLVDDKKQSKDSAPPQVKGYDVAWSLSKDYENKDSEDYKYYLKSRELDEFFIKKAIDNKKEWLKMPDDDEETFASLKKLIGGKDEYGYMGKWKGILKWSRNKEEDKTGKKLVNKYYPPRINSSFKVKFYDEVDTEVDPPTKMCDFESKIYNANGDSLKVNHRNYKDLIPKFSQFSMLCSWAYLSASKDWITLNSQIQQCVVVPRESVSFDENYLKDDDDESCASLPDEVNYMEETTSGSGSKEDEAIEEFQEEEDTGSKKKRFGRKTI
jgi:hypothetical protein